MFSSNLTTNLYLRLESYSMFDAIRCMYQEYLLEKHMQPFLGFFRPLGIVKAIIIDHKIVGELHLSYLSHLFTID
jgi:hypothetical protein